MPEPAEPDLHVAPQHAAKRCVALLYSVVLGEGRRLLMADFRALAEELGLGNPRTLVATGNLVFDAGTEPPGDVEARLETAFAARFGKRIPVIVRTAAAWRRLVAANPFPEVAASDGAALHVRVMREAALPAELERLRRYATNGEIIRLVDGDIFIHFAGRRPSEGRLLGQFTTKRGGAGTLRNWNTVTGIAALLEG